MDPTFITHKLNVDPMFLPKKQKPRRSAKQHVEVVKEEVEKLRQAGDIKEVFFPEWLSNTVGSEKEEREVESLCRFYRLKQSVR